MISTFGSCCNRNNSRFSMGPLTVVGVEDSFLSFEDIQRRAAESAALPTLQRSASVSRSEPRPVLMMKAPCLICSIR